jgi:hypothetical protein
MSQARFQKSLREKARKEKANAKRERKAARADGTIEGEDGEVAAPVDQQVVLAELAKLHESFEAGSMDFEAFEERKRELVEQLSM